MISVFLREQKRYSLKELAKAFHCSGKEAVPILKRLKEYGVLMAVHASDRQRNLTDLAEENVEPADINAADIEAGESGYLYVFTFVGVITLITSHRRYVLKFCPKYLPDGIFSPTELKDALKQVLRVLEKYNSQEQIIRMYNETDGRSAFNRLAVRLFLLRDYIENGPYTNTQDITETNGSGEILWEKTVNETFTLLSGNRPYYPELLTRKRIYDDTDYFTRLHKCIVTCCSQELRDADLLDLFDIMGAEISDECLEDFGDTEYVLCRIERELSVQFSTRKQHLLKTLYAYVKNSSLHDNLDCFSMFGTNSFNLVWEKVCAEVLDNQLQKPIGCLPVPLAGQYRTMRRKKLRLIDLIDRPQWTGTAQDGSAFVKEAPDTLVPDIVSVMKADDKTDGGNCRFIIFDAKYYNLQLEPDKELRGQPGIESITKQYLYQLAFRHFTEAHGMDVQNCFLLPSASEEVIEKGTVTLAMLKNLGLKDIQIRLLPAGTMYKHYLEGRRLDARSLHL